MNLYELIQTDISILKYSQKNNKDINSLSFLIDPSLKNLLTQSDYIKIGTILENLLNKYILLNNSNLENIKIKPIKGKKETDHLFLDKSNNRIIYAELKSNLNLDTEKTPATINKCINIYNDLKDKYPKYEISWYIVSLRFLHKNNFPQFIKKKYYDVSNNVIGIDEYLKILNINSSHTINEQSYIELLNFMIKSILKL